MTDYELKGKTAIVTGGSDGLGRATAIIIPQFNLSDPKLERIYFIILSVKIMPSGQWHSGSALYSWGN